ELRELLEGCERVLPPARLELALGVLQEPPPGVRQETLTHAQAPELAIELDPVGLVAKRLAAERDRVVVEPFLRVLVRRFLVVAHRLGGTPKAQVQVADTVEERELQIRLTRTGTLQHLFVRLYRLVPL